MDEGMQIGWMQNSQLEMVEGCLIGLVVESARVPFPTPANDELQDHLLLGTPIGNWVEEDLEKRSFHSDCPVPCKRQHVFISLVSL